MARAIEMRILTAVLSLFVAGQAFAGEADGVGDFWRAKDEAVLATTVSIANAAGLFPAISLALEPGAGSNGWILASLITGSTQITLGAVSVADGAAYHDQRWLIGYGVATSVLGLTNLLLAIVNLYRSDDMTHELEILAVGVAPMPVAEGAGATVSFDF